jgi:hypothetical protein
LVVRIEIALTLLLACAAVGCRSTAKPPACGTRDAGVVEVEFEVPPGCPPAEANELGIGKPCTMCGNECAAPLRCTCDSYLGVQLTGVPCVCSRLQLAPIGSTDPCASAGANFCGSNTTCCNAATTAAYCVPNICLIDGVCIEFELPDAGTDGATDM